MATTSLQAATLSRPVVDALAPVLVQARQETARALTEFLRTENGAARYTAQAYRNTLVQLDQSLATIARLSPVAFQALASQLRPASQLAATHVQRELARYSGVFEGTVRTIPIHVARVLATGQSLIIPRFAASAARYAGNVRDDIKRELAVGVVRGESVDQLSQRLRRIGGFRRAIGATPDDARIADGLFGRYAFWADRVARTEMSAAYNTLVDETIRDARYSLPDICRRWDATLDRRVCEVCEALDGAVARVDGTFPGGLSGAPAHPLCRCRVGAWRHEWTAILSEAGS